MTGESGHRRTRRPAWARALAGSTLVVSILFKPALAAPRAGPAECRAGPARAETLAGIGPRGEIRLASGGRAVLDSLRWPDGDDAAAASAWLEARRGTRLTLVPRGQPDRWGRERVDAQLEDGPAGDDLDLAGGLVGAGLAYADADEADALCRPALLTVEATAREKRLGLWRRAPPAAEDGPALRALEGRFAVVEGVVRHVGERPARTYLDFVARGADGLTVTLSKRVWRTLRARGLDADALRDRRVRVRGLVEIRRGPTIEAAADGIEMLGREGPGRETGRLPDRAPGDIPGGPSPSWPGGERGLRR